MSRSISSISGITNEPRLYQLEKNLFKVQIKSPITHEHIDLLANGINGTFKEGAKSHLIIDLEETSDFTIEHRKKIIELLESHFSKKSLSKIYLINLNPFLRGLIGILSILHSKIKLEYPNSEKEAIRLYLLDIGEINVDIKQIREALDKRISNKLVTILDYKQHINDSKPNSFIETYLIAPNIICIKFSGYISNENVKKLTNHLDSLFANNESFIVINNLSNSNGISIRARASLFKWGIDNEKLILHSFLKLNSFHSALFKIYSNVSFGFINNITIVKSVAEIIFKLSKEKIQTDFPQSIQDKKQVGLSIEELEKLEKSDLISFIKKLEKDQFESAQLRDKRFSEVFSFISNLTWNKDFRTKEIQKIPENDPYFDLFIAMDILRKDVNELLGRLKSSNTDLEKRVKERVNQLKLKEQNIIAIIESIEAPVWIIDRNYILLEFNSTFSKQAKTNHGIELIKGKNILKMFPSDMAEQFKSIYDTVFKSGNLNVNIGEAYGRYSEIRFFQIKNNQEAIGICALTIDLTEITKFKNQLEEKNSKLEKLNAEMDSFIYRSSHDLRAPISSVKGLIELAKMESDPIVKKEYYAMMEKSMDKLDGFIHEIMDITRNSKLLIEVEPIELKNEVQHILDELSYNLVSDKIQIKNNINSEIILNSDRQRVKTVLKNILANSIKYRDEKKESYVELNSTIKEGVLILVINDNGNGIGENELPKVKEMFFRASLTKSGSGLGLYIVNEIVQKLNGTLDIESKENVYTKVTLTLPLELNVESPKKT